MLTRKTLATGVAASTIMFGFGAVAPAWATSNIQVLGVQETVKDINGPLTGYTVTGLMPSSDPVPYPVGQGGSSTGKVYFDVVGSTPNSVVYNNGFEDILGWIQPPGLAPEEVAPARPAATRVNRAVLVCPPLSVVPASERQNRCRGSSNSGCFCSSEFVARRRARRQSRLQVSGYGP